MSQSALDGASRSFDIGRKMRDSVVPSKVFNDITAKTDMFLTVDALLAYQTFTRSRLFEANKFPKHPKDQHSGFRPRNIGRHKEMKSFNGAGVFVEVGYVPSSGFRAEMLNYFGTARKIGMGEHWWRASKADVDISEGMFGRVWGIENSNKSFHPTMQKAFTPSPHRRTVSQG